MELEAKRSGKCNLFIVLDFLLELLNTCILRKLKFNLRIIRHRKKKINGTDTHSTNRKDEGR